MDPAGPVREPSRFLLPLLVAVVLAGIAWFSWGLDLSRRLSADGMRALIEAHPPYGPLVFMGMVVAAIVSQVPMMSNVVIAVGGVLFSGPAAFAYAWIASLVGTTVVFLLVRHLARDAVHELLSHRLAKVRALDERIAGNGFWTVFVLRLVGGLAPPLSWGLGLTGVRNRHYVIGTALGVVPTLGLTLLFGDSIVRALPGRGFLAPGHGLGAVAVLRGVALLAFGGPLMLLRSRRETGGAEPDDRGSRLPLAANFAGFALFFFLLIGAAGTTDGAPALLLAIGGAVLALAGCALVLRSRAALGRNWNFVPEADESSGFVTTGPYRLVRHPIYLGLSLLAAGQAVAFASVPALVTAFAAVVPTFLWRAGVEESVLTRVFGDRYRAYREQTKMIVPYLL